VRDNQPKHRQLRRKGRRLERKKATRAGLPAILIVCEGKETEPNYLHGLCDAHGINRANVTVIPGDGETNATRLVEKAQRRFLMDRDFDAVFVICDCAGEDLAAARAHSTKPITNTSGQTLFVQMIVSRPCFEFWLLLHFEYAARPFQTADSVVDILKRHVTDYDKADRQIFEKVGAGLDRALGNVARLKTELAAIRAKSPDSDMPYLINSLMSLRRRDKRRIP
jgi:RloB-like protein